MLQDIGSAKDGSLKLNYFLEHGILAKRLKEKGVKQLIDGCDRITTDTVEDHIKEFNHIRFVGYGFLHILFIGGSVLLLTLMG